jgi:hypothetical protein
MSHLAVAATHSAAAQKIGQVPVEFWLKLGAAVLIVVVVIVLLRKLAQANKVVLAVVVLVALSTLGFSWIYNRNEPSWASPVVDKLAGFFPSKGSYTVKQHR